MKKYILVGLAILMFLCGCTLRSEYTEGRDTVESYLGGEYQILKRTGYPPQKENRILTLKNMKYRIDLIDFVNQYKKVKKIVYFVGITNGKYIYTQLDLNIGHVKYFIENGTLDDLQISHIDELLQDGTFEIISDISQFSEDDVNIFQSLK